VRTPYRYFQEHPSGVAFRVVNGQAELPNGEQIRFRPALASTEAEFLRQQRLMWDRVSTVQPMIERLAKPYDGDVYNRAHTAASRAALRYDERSGTWEAFAYVLVKRAISAAVRQMNCRRVPAATCGPCCRDSPTTTARCWPISRSMASRSAPSRPNGDLASRQFTSATRS